MSNDLFEGVGAKEYNGVWGVWKLGSLGLFGVFVACAIDIAISMRRHAGRYPKKRRMCWNDRSERCSTPEYCDSHGCQL